MFCQPPTIRTLSGLTTYEMKGLPGISLPFHLTNILNKPTSTGVYFTINDPNRHVQIKNSKAKNCSMCVGADLSDDDDNNLIKDDQSDANKKQRIKFNIPKKEPSLFKKSKSLFVLELFVVRSFSP